VSPITFLLVAVAVEMAYLGTTVLFTILVPVCLVVVVAVEVTEPRQAPAQQEVLVSLVSEITEEMGLLDRTQEVAEGPVLPELLLLLGSEALAV
jgi:hypothetical protein